MPSVQPGPRDPSQSCCSHVNSLAPWSCPPSRALGPCLLTLGLNDDRRALLMTKIADVWSWHLQPSAAAISSSRDVPQRGHCSGAEPRDIPVIGLSYMNPCTPGSVFSRLPHPLAFLFGLASGRRRRKGTPSSRPSFHWSALGHGLAAPHPSTALACSFNSISAKWVFWGWITFRRKFVLPPSFLPSFIWSYWSGGFSFQCMSDSMNTDHAG